MPKETKEQNKENKKAEVKKTASASKSKKNSTSKVATKTTTRKSSTQKTSKKTASSSKAKIVSKKSKTTVTKSKNNTPAKKNSRTKTAKPANKKVLKQYLPEYYDLPYRYNETVIKLLFQTPKTLFVYWDISDSDRQNFIDTYGYNFFSETKPVLVIHNKTLNYSFELDINDFANCWYFDVENPECEYIIELGRRPVSSIQIPNNYLQIATSNKIEIPNNRILFDKTSNTVFFRNVKDNTTFSKNITTFNFIKKAEKIYNTQNIYDIYKKLYSDEKIIESLDNPSSNFKII